MKSSLQTLIRDLARRRARERRGLAVAEGVRLVEEALAAGAALRGAVVSPALETTTRGKALKAALVRHGVRLEETTPAELDALADTEHPQGVVAVFEPRRWTLEDIPLRPGAAVLVLDGVQDPGNVGTILRTALGLGAAGVIALKGTADLTNPKVVRGSMGALFRLPAVPTDAEEFLTWARRHNAQIWITAANATPIRETTRRVAAQGRGPHRRTVSGSGGEAPGPVQDQGAPPPIALVLGNEGAGATPMLEAAAHERVAIPLTPGAESLNVAVAAGILLYEVTRDD